ncbi:MAG: cytidine deaminase, partial [Paracoccaceae bacterium]
EAGAIAAMVAAGETKLSEVYVIAGSPKPVPPCGGCRQKLSEFGAGDVVVTMATTAGVEQATTIGDLLPGAFDAEFLKGT